MIKIRLRVLVGVMIFLGFFLMYIVRYNISVHIVDMIRMSSKKMSNREPHVARNADTKLRFFGSIGTFINWDDMKIATLFSAYHIGYCICFPIFHNIGDSLGPTWIVVLSGILSGGLNCLTPAATLQGFWFLFTVRMITGFCAGAMQPSMVQVLRHWVPPVERHHFMWVYCGVTLGTFSTLIICALVQYYSKWSLGFYVTGGLQIAWATVWAVTVTETPQRSNWISQDELEYLNSTIGTVCTIRLTNHKAPWKLIIRSRAFWCVCILNFGYAWMIISLTIYGPLYYSMVIGYDIANAAVITAIPFLFRFVLGLMAIQLFHRYKMNNSLEKTKIMRKYLIVVSHVIPGLLMMSLWLTSIIPGPVWISVSVALTAVGMDSSLDLCYVMSPNYVNSIHTVVKIIGNIPGIVASYVVGGVTFMYDNDPGIWKHAWCCHASILFLSGVIFLLWGETDVQSWNYVSIRQRATRRPIALTRPSVMSHISEIDDEEDCSYINNNRPTSGAIKSFLNIHTRSSNA